MQNRRIGTGLALLGALAVPTSTHAQSVMLDGGDVEVLDTDGDSAVLIDNGANYTAGGNGRTATLNLRGSDRPATLFYHAFQAQLVIGGGTHEGIVLIKDNDGVTTTIDLDGRTGAIRLGGNGEDGDLLVYDNSDLETFRVNGQSGSATNRLGANGLVKAWARINSDGTVLSCWRCDPAQTQFLGGGGYRVDFSPLGADVRSRPRSVVIDSHAGGEEQPGTVRIRDAFESSAVGVQVSDMDGFIAERSFTVFVY